MKGMLKAPLYIAVGVLLLIVLTSGLYIVDDMLPQPNWPEGHAAEVEAFMDILAARPDLHVATLEWSTGVIIATKAGRA